MKTYQSNTIYSILVFDDSVFYLEIQLILEQFEFKLYESTYEDLFSVNILVIFWRFRTT